MTYRSRILNILHSVGTGLAFLAECLPLPPSAQAASTPSPDSYTFQFLPAVSYQSGGAESQFVVAADVNGDGFSDAIVSNPTSEDITIFIGRGDGVFTRASTYNIPSAWKIRVADVNGDHKIDLLISSGTNVAVMLGNGDGTFATPAMFDAGDDVRALAVADVNRDGALDVVTASYNTGAISVLLGHGDGSFAAPLIYPTNAASLQLVEVADFNRDGKPDLAISSYGSPVGGGIMLGNGDGSFQAPIGLNEASAIAIGDMNGDGKMDLVTGGPVFELDVLLGNGDGTFTTVSNRGQTGQLALADMNNDGKLDVLFTYPYGKLAGVMVGNGDGTLQA